MTPNPERPAGGAILWLVLVLTMLIGAGLFMALAHVVYQPPSVETTR